MKDLIKLIVTLLAGAIAAAIPLVCFYLLWSFCVAQIPVGFAYAGLVKVGITLAMVLFGGSATVGLAILGGFFAIYILAHVFDVR